MIYLLLIYAREADWTTKSETEMASVKDVHNEIEQSLRRAGKYKGCGGLAPTTAAKTVRIRDGKTVVTDGPYGDSREHLGGYYLVDANDLDEALSFAARIPGFGDRAIEVRPVMDFRPG